MTKFNEYLQEQLKNPEFRKEYEALEPEFSNIRNCIEKKQKQQKENN